MTEHGLETTYVTSGKFIIEAKDADCIAEYAKTYLVDWISRNAHSFIRDYPIGSCPRDWVRRASPVIKDEGIACMIVSRLMAIKAVLRDSFSYDAVSIAIDETSMPEVDSEYRMNTYATELVYKMLKSFADFRSNVYNNAWRKTITITEQDLDKKSYIIVSSARLPIKFRTFKELYDGLSNEFRKVIELEFYRKDIRGDVDEMEKCLMKMLPKIRGYDEANEAYNSFTKLGRSNRNIKNSMNVLISTAPLFLDDKRRFVNSMYVIAFGMIYEKMYRDEEISNRKRICK